MKGNESGGIKSECPFCNLANVNVATVDRAPEQRFNCQDIVHGIQKHTPEYLVFKMCAMGPKVVRHVIRLPDLALAFKALAQNALGGFQNLFFGVCSVGDPQVVGAHLCLPRRNCLVGPEERAVGLDCTQKQARDSKCSVGRNTEEEDLSLPASQASQCSLLEAKPGSMRIGDHFTRDQPLDSSLVTN